MSTTEENAILNRLVCDLASKKTLCCCDDYPGVSEKVLNEYLAEHCPLTNPVFWKMGVFWIDEGYFVPGRDVVPGCCELAPVIGTKVSQWSNWSGGKESLMLSVGAYIYDERTRTPTTVRTPDVSFIPRNASRDLSVPQLWQLHSGEPYAPSFVVEIDRLSGEDSQMDVLDDKMRNEFFTHGVQLGWLIDPRPECRKMVEYKLNEAGEVFHVDNDSWRDLDGGMFFPGFTFPRRTWRWLWTQTSTWWRTRNLTFFALNEAVASTFDLAANGLLTSTTICANEQGSSTWPNTQSQVNSDLNVVLLVECTTTTRSVKILDKVCEEVCM